MSSHEDPHYYSGPSPIYSESSSESPVARQPRLPGQSWPQTATTGDQSGYSQPHQSLDTIGNLLQDHDAEDMNYPFNFPGPSYPLPSTWSQDLGVGTDATYTNDDIPSHPLVNLPFYPYTEFGHEFSQHQHGYASYDFMQPSAYYVPQHPAQDVQSQTSQDHFAPGYPYSSPTPLPQVSSDGPVYLTDARLAQPTPDNLTLDGADTARTDAGAGQHSHQYPVATSSANQSSAPGPSRPPPSSPGRKRLLPLSAAGEVSISTARRVVPRHDRAWSVHPTSPSSPRRSRSNSAVHGRGPLIPQERYTTSTISSYNTPDRQPAISFNLENPSQIGIPIIDILNKTDGYARVRDRTEAFDMGKKTFTLRVQWPGYGPWAKTIAAKDWTKSRAPITRVKLAEAVATAIRHLFERYRDKRYDTDYERWNIGPNGIRLDQICLVALHHVSRGSWQPELCLLESRH